MSALIDAGIFTAVRHHLVRWSSPSLISHRVHYRFAQAIIWLGPTLIWGIIFPCSSPWGKSHVKPFSSSTLPRGHDWIKSAFSHTDGEALNYPASGGAGNGIKSKGCDAPIKDRVYSFPSNSLGKLQPLRKNRRRLWELPVYWRWTRKSCNQQPGEELDLQWTWLKHSAVYCVTGAVTSPSDYLTELFMSPLASWLWGSQTMLQNKYWTYNFTTEKLLYMIKFSIVKPKIKHQQSFFYGKINSYSFIKKKYFLGVLEIKVLRSLVN